MAELNGYPLTEEEEKACAELVKKLRERKTYDLDFTGSVFIRARTEDEAINIFWDWVDKIQDVTRENFPEITCLPYFEMAESNLQE